MHDYDGCAPCDCVEKKKKEEEEEEVGPHCQHCYHCLACSSAVAMGCRPCPSSPDRSFYRSYIVRRRKDGDDYYASFDHDCDNWKEGDEVVEWCSCMGGIQSPCIYPNSPDPLDGEEAEKCDADDDEDAEGRECEELDFGEQEFYPAEPFPPTTSSETLQKQAEEALEKIWGGDRSKMPGLKKE